MHLPETTKQPVAEADSEKEALGGVLPCPDEIKKRADRCQIAVSTASICQELGLEEEAHQWLKQAKRWGWSRRKISRALVQQVHELLLAPVGCQAEASSQAQDSSREFSGKSLENSIRQMPERINLLKSRISASDPLASHISILSAEIELLQHELSIAQARGQLDMRALEAQEPPATLEEANARWEENLRTLATSQLGQDVWVLQRTSYKRNGFFVEFGATNGILLSNSYLLEKEFGWNGLCAEPNPGFYEELVKNRRCITSPACIGPVTGEEVEFVFADAYGGMMRDMGKDDHREKREAYVNSGAHTRLTTISLQDFLKEHNAPRTIDYLSIDTEGSEFSILETFPFSEWDIRHITVEHNYTEQRRHIRSLLSGHGYACREMMFDDWYYLER